MMPDEETKEAPPVQTQSRCNEQPEQRAVTQAQTVEPQLGQAAAQAAPCLHLCAPLWSHGLGPTSPASASLLAATPRTCTGP